MKRITLTLASTLVIILLLNSAVRASSDGGYTLDWFAVSSGGGQTSSGAYTLGGTVGQPYAGQLSGGAYTLNGGFGAASETWRIYFPLVQR